VELHGTPAAPLLHPKCTTVCTPEPAPAQQCSAVQQTRFQCTLQVHQTLPMLLYNAQTLQRLQLVMQQHCGATTAESAPEVKEGDGTPNSGEALSGGQAQKNAQLHDAAEPSDAPGSRTAMRGNQGLPGREWRVVRRLLHAAGKASAALRTVRRTECTATEQDGLRCTPATALRLNAGAAASAVAAAVEAHTKDTCRVWEEVARVAHGTSYADASVREHCTTAASLCRNASDTLQRLAEAGLQSIAQVQASHAAAQRGTAQVHARQLGQLLVPVHKYVHRHLHASVTRGMGLMRGWGVLAHILLFPPSHAQHPLAMRFNAAQLAGQWYNNLAAADATATEHILQQADTLSALHFLLQEAEGACTSAADGVQLLRASKVHGDAARDVRRGAQRLHQVLLTLQRQWYCAAHGDSHAAVCDDVACSVQRVPDAHAAHSARLYKCAARRSHAILRQYVADCGSSVETAASAIQNCLRVCEARARQVQQRDGGALRVHTGVRPGQGSVHAWLDAVRDALREADGVLRAGPSTVQGAWCSAYEE